MAPPRTYGAGGTSWGNVSGGWLSEHRCRSRCSARRLVQQHGRCRAGCLWCGSARIRNAGCQRVWAASDSAYPPTASSYPATGAGGYPALPAAILRPAPHRIGHHRQARALRLAILLPYAGAASGGPVAQTADSRYSQYNSSAPATNGYSSPAAGTAYPASSTAPAAPAAGAYQGSAYPATPASTTSPSASASYRPGGTSDYVPTSPGGTVPSGYGATGSGVRPAGYDEAYSSPPGEAMPATPASNSLNVAVPVDGTMTR